MKKEDKELLLKDLSARLPYEVKVQVPKRISINPLRVYAIEQMYESTFYCERNGWLCKFWNETFARIDEVKPYLRPMSSMTEEERKEYYSTQSEYTHRIYPDSADFSEHTEYSWTAKTIDWLNANHFDYHGLIPKGLALEAPKDMYNEIEEEKK